MSVEENKAIVRHFVEALWNKGDLSTADALLAPDFVNHSARAGTPADREAFQQSAALTRTTFPDFHVTIDDLIGEGDKVAARFTARGTHQVEWLHPIVGPIASTGRQVTWTGIRIFHMRDGKIAETWLNVDTLDVMQQLGAIPAQAHVMG